MSLQLLIGILIGSILGSLAWVLDDGFMTRAEKRQEKGGLSMADTDNLSRYKPVGWYGKDGSGLTEGALWGDCPHCESQCVYVDGKRTSWHNHHPMNPSRHKTPKKKVTLNDR